MLKSTNSSKGFTLVEILVVIFIVALMSTLILVNFRSSQKQNNVKQATQKLAADVSRARNYALAVQIESGSPLTPTGYGIFVDIVAARRYILFFNTNSALVYQPGVSLIKETIDWSSGITVTPTGSAYFAPPDPTTYLNGQPNAAPLVLTVSSDDGSFSQTITIYNNGRIEIK